MHYGIVFNLFYLKRVRLCLTINGLCINYPVSLCLFVQNEYISSKILLLSHKDFNGSQIYSLKSRCSERTFPNILFLFLARHIRLFKSKNYIQVVFFSFSPSSYRNKVWLISCSFRFCFFSSFRNGF